MKTLYIFQKLQPEKKHTKKHTTRTNKTQEENY